MENYIWLIPAFPLIGFIINGLIGKRMPQSFVSFIGVSSIGLSFLVSIALFVKLIGLPAEDRILVDTLFTWMSSGDFSVNLSYMVDPLSSVMILIVTGVGFLIHVYSTGYMHSDKSYYRYFAYLNLFVFFMLNLVLGDNYLVMFLGWEGVGLASYLLIGFWFEEKANAIAGKKAFVVNRIGDFGFSLGMLLIIFTFGSLNYHEVFTKAVEMYNAQALSLNGAVIVAITLLLFVGATGKSAQIPLYVWLPDAMAGPTPVSALIHAATMVTAGVYMVARSNILFTLAPTTLLVLSLVAAATALFAASIGILQRDIKKVLAYSTVSQLGYMFIGVGVGAYTAGVFHLMTHAFFKALLFLGAGSVIHAMSGKQDMEEMGGLKKYLPITFATMTIGTIAIAGIPPFAGFFSKDEILWQAYNFVYFPEIGKLIWLMGAAGAGVTAFYMFRLWYMTFFGAERMDDETKHHIHESPFSMTGVLIVLAILSVVGGLVGIPSLLGHPFNIPNFFESYLEPVFEESSKILAGFRHGHLDHSLEGKLMVLSVAIALVGIFASTIVYKWKTSIAEYIKNSATFAYDIIFNKYYIDEIYEMLIIRPINRASVFLWKFVDAVIIDGIFVNGTAFVVKWCSSTVRVIQTGSIQTYGMFMIVGLVAMLAFFLIK